MQVYDLAWSPTGEYIIAGSTDNCARIFTATEGEVSEPAFLSITTDDHPREMRPRDCRTQSLRAGRGLGPAERIRGDAEQRPVHAHLQHLAEEQRHAGGARGGEEHPDDDGAPPTAHAYSELTQSQSAAACPARIHRERSRVDPHQRERVDEGRKLVVFAWCEREHEQPVDDAYRFGPEHAVIDVPTALVV